MNLDPNISLPNSVKEGEIMYQPDEVGAMLALAKKGWGVKRIAREFNISKNTVKSYLKKGGWIPYKKINRPKILDGIMDWVEQQFFLHGGNAEVVRQELLAKRGIKVHPRTLQRAVAPLRQRIGAAVKATVRFETAPGQQLQIDFGSMQVQIGEDKMKLFFFVATLGYSRRNYVKVFLHERQAAWFEGLEGCFRYFDGIPKEVLIDNPKPLVTKHNILTREVEFNARFRAFATYWQFRPRACAPYRARTKGKGGITESCVWAENKLSVSLKA